MNRTSARLRALGLSALLLATNLAQAAPGWVADAARSRLEFTGTLAGGTFDGSFRRFRPEIAFDPADLAASRFLVTIETGSVRFRSTPRVWASRFDGSTVRARTFRPSFLPPSNRDVSSGSMSERRNFDPDVIL